eukprot:TRINITY_DN7997_c0_g1_i1.p1 TRINITY_DN7997_c0_g1~~TRINITY_DN7997_c0_g1_i1.p1  ORF type:complete len:211 (-),score=45.20 TRINITY_DN7997_c0_g1_i1:17-649(-)
MQHKRTFSQFEEPTVVYSSMPNVHTLPLTIPKGRDAGNIDEETAFMLLMLNRDSGQHAEDDMNKRRKLNTGEAVSTSSEIEHRHLYRDDISEHTSSSSTSSRKSKTGKKKRVRHRTTPEQFVVLHEHYQTEKTPDLETRKVLAKRLGMTPRRVQVWFQNRRAKDKREAKEARLNTEESNEAIPESEGTSIESSDMTEDVRARLSIMSLLN